MARFFKNLKEEEKDIQKKVDIISENKDKILTEKEKKLQELDRRVNEIMSSPKNMEKGTRKLFGDIKKFTKYFEQNKIPESLFELISDKRILKFSSTKSLVKIFLKNYPKEEKLVFGDNLDNNENEESNSNSNDNKIVEESNNKLKIQKNKKKDDFENRLASIIQIKCFIEKESELLKMLKEKITEEEIYRIIIALLMVYKGVGNTEKMIWILEDSLKYFNIDGTSMKMLGESLDYYFRLIYEKLKKEDYKRYEELLDKFEEINKEVCMIRKLEFKFFKLSIDVDTKDKRFYLLHLVRQNDWKSSEKYFLENKSLFISELNIHRVNMMNIEILKEFWKLGIENGGFLTVFYILEYFYKLGYLEVKLILYALCVILNEKVKTSEVFNEFLSNFRSININKYMLKSKNSKDEILRSFYLFNMCDYKESSEIIFNITGINCKNALKESILEGFLL